MESDRARHFFFFFFCFFFFFFFFNTYISICKVKTRPVSHIPEQGQKICQKSWIQRFAIAKSQHQLVNPLSVYIIAKQFEIVRQQSGSLAAISKNTCGGRRYFPYSAIIQKSHVPVITFRIGNGSADDVFQCCFQVGCIPGFQHDHSALRLTGQVVIEPRQQSAERRNIRANRKKRRRNATTIPASSS